MLISGGHISNRSIPLYIYTINWTSPWNWKKSIPFIGLFIFFKHQRHWKFFVPFSASISRCKCDIWTTVQQWRSFSCISCVPTPITCRQTWAGRWRRLTWTFVDRFWASTCDRLKRSTACRRNSQILSRRPTRLLYNIHVGLSFDWVNSCSIQSETPKSSIFWLNSSRIRHF